MNDKFDEFEGFVTARCQSNEWVALIKLLVTNAKREIGTKTEEIQAAYKRITQKDLKVPSIVHALRQELDSVLAAAPRNIVRFEIRNRSRQYWLQPPEDPPSLPLNQLFVPVQDFRRLFVAMCELAGLDNEARSAKFTEWIRSGSRGELPAFAERKEQEGKSFDEVLGSFSADYRQEIAATEVRSLAKFMTIRPVLLDSLLSEPCATHALPVDLSDFVHVQEDGRTLSGETADEAFNAKYFVPNRRLAGADAAIGWVRLEAHGRSEHHVHPGDEIVFVRCGRAEVHLTQSGSRTTLEKHEVMHFHADSWHRIVNPAAQRAELLIIRFYQVDANTRQVLWRDLDRRLAVGESAGPIHPHAAAWIRQVLPSYSHQPSRGPTDGLGLARFLEECSRLASGTAPERRTLEDADPAAIAEIPSFAKLASEYGIQEFLLANFAAPAVPGMIALRDEDFTQTATAEASESEARYFLPARALSCSDSAISKVKLPIGTSATKMNSHPGFEFLIVTEGEVQVIFEDRAPLRLSVNGPQMCHFDSTVPHSVANVESGVEAEFFVFRFYRDGAQLRPLGHSG